MIFNRRGLLSAAAALSIMTAMPATAADPSEIHFLIPGGAGGGWDGTARGIGDALTKAGLIETASYENMSGGGGGKAIAHLIETADQQENTLMVNSTPIVIRSLQGVFPQNFRDLTPVAVTIGDYAVLAVATDSEVEDFSGLVEAYQADSSAMPVAGGSVAGGMDHLVAALIMKAAGADPTAVKYVPYDSGGKAMAGLLSGEAKVLSTGLSEALELAAQDQVRILCVTSPERLDAAPDVPACAEAGAEGVDFVNWRGFFAAPGVGEEQQQGFVNVIEQMYETPAWEEVRDRNGWVEIYHAGDDFTAFLEAQEEQISTLMKELGFL